MTLQKKAFFKHIFCLAVCLPTLSNHIRAQECPGSWALQRPLAAGCFTGQWIGWQNTTNPVGCPLNPVYAGTQINTFTFDAPVSEFSVDLDGIDGTPLCPRIEIKINGLFYPITNTNLNDIPQLPNCTGSSSFSYLTVTGDGYITTSLIGGPGRSGCARLRIANVNATTLSFSTNDGFGTVFSNPFNCLNVVPINLLSFFGHSTSACEASLNWRTAIESNVKFIEVQESQNGVLFKTVKNVLPKGSNSNYSIKIPSPSDLLL